MNAQCMYRGYVSADLSADSVVMNLPDGRSVVLPMEVREDGIYALIDETAQAVIDDAVRVARERQEAMLMFGLPPTPSRYAYTSPVIEGPPRTPRAAGRRITGKRAQRRLSKPWAGRRT